ncbi:MAG: ectoine/hydroxyectoine ABC transporter permease subunit EhuC [Candidatus Carbobacillus sp.]|nr:ectoine/hydroxyectoine ABC transporter permease subunit EhuC [Candidatus Carbobacillus sp.]
MTSLETLIRILPSLMKGLMVTLEVFFLGSVIAALLAFIAGMMRLSKFRIVRFVAAVYVEFFRGTSLLIQLFWIFYVLPFFGVDLSAMMAGVLALGLNYGAYGSEVVRSAIRAVPKGQTEAAIALNMAPTLRFRRIILPQAWPLMIPPFGNLLIELLKGTSLVSLITLSDLTFQAMSLRTTVSKLEIPIFALLLIIYFVIAYAVTLIMRAMEKKATVGRV